MKVTIVRPGVASHALDRIQHALIDHAPEDMRFVIRNADLAVILCVGRHDATMKLAAQFERYAVIQLCVRSTQKPHTANWLPLWLNAKVVWSYYDLPTLMEDDGLNYAPFNFYRAPLGVDPVFTSGHSTVPGRYLALAHGGGRLVESVREIVLAAKRVGGKVCFLGKELGIEGVTCYSKLTDDVLARLYRQCVYVSGLRRIEGFELPAAEGLLCGARPILFDREHYRHWFGDMAEYIPEGSRAEVIDSLEAVFRGRHRPVTVQERIHAAMVFDWRKSVEGFWERCV